MNSCFKDDKECAGHLVFRFLITGSVNVKAEECNGHFLRLITGSFKKDKKYAGHLVSPFLMTGSVKEDKECAGYLVFLFLLTGYRSCRQCALRFW